MHDELRGIYYLLILIKRVIYKMIIIFFIHLFVFVKFCFFGVSVIMRKRVKNKR
ncbi:hypothetical protein BDCR2A_01552 [Borrelia duttonii CR2A]|uniref:Uncharacterized protein n=2 Tax=Borrelia TaxID=138 RepID=W6TGI0_9SPIR|nr:hypothetical protein BCD_1586 [Borrelia crocidurae DOU]ETZ17530.1 hypothetical protein BDCR2A_01552 [Borrelia duttonii CR2A]